jgi:release factor glutamine methyltransferase
MITQPLLRPWRTRPAMSDAVTLRELYQTLKKTMTESDARYVLRKRAGVDHSDLITNPDKELDSAVVTLIRQDIQTVEEGKPLSKIYGEREFWGLRFEVSEDTLDPRPDTETLVEAVLKDCDPKRAYSILDMGTGTGCILIALLSELPNARGVGVDVSLQALEKAKANAQQNQVADRSTFIQSNWSENIEERFDIVVSNPPYIRSDVIPELADSVKNHDPILALDGGEDGLQAYKEIFSQLSELLKPHGKAFFEIGYDQSETVTRLSRESRFSHVESYADSAGHIRVLEVRPDDHSGDK